MACAFDNNGVCTAGIMNVFGCPKNCAKYVEYTNVNLNLQITEKDREIIDICKRIRQAVAARNVIVQQREHRKSDNLHLVKFIELCGKTFSEFVLEYLANIQPFQLIRDNLQEFDDEVKCVIDLSYSLAVYVKIKFQKDDAVVISFHENQLAKHSVYQTLIGDTNYAITKTIAQPGYRCILPVDISHGLVIFKLELACLVVEEDLIKISFSDIERAYTQYANDKVDMLIGKGSGRTFSSMKEISFTSYGETLLNDVSTLVDAICYSNISADSKGLMVEVLHIKLREILLLPDAELYLDAINKRYSTKLGPVVEKTRLLLGLEG